ncbi:hypothetical protein VTG60DRAFT_3836 [Thermothelomyces hinnuleus]
MRAAAASQLGNALLRHQPLPDLSPDPLGHHLLPVRPQTVRVDGHLLERLRPDRQEPALERRRRPALGDGLDEGRPPFQTAPRLAQVREHHGEAVRHGLVLLPDDRDALAPHLVGGELVLVRQQLPAGADVDGRRAGPRPGRHRAHERVIEQRVGRVQVPARRRGRPRRAGGPPRVGCELLVQRRQVVERRVGRARRRRVRDVQPGGVDGDAAGERDGPSGAVPEDGVGVAVEVEDQLEEGEREVAARTFVRC